MLGKHRRETRLKLAIDRKSTRLNSSHSQMSYAVFCLKKKTLISLPFRALSRHLVLGLCLQLMEVFAEMPCTMAVIPSLVCSCPTFYFTSSWQLLQATR